MQALPELRELTLDFNDVHSSGALAVAHATVRPRPTLLYSTLLLLFNTPPQRCAHIAEGLDAGGGGAETGAARPQRQHYLSSGNAPTAQALAVHMMGAHLLLAADFCWFWCVGSGDREAAEHARRPAGRPQRQ